MAKDLNKQVLLQLIGNYQLKIEKFKHKIGQLKTMISKLESTHVKSSDPGTSEAI